jgi:predicted nucleic acid-binding protein
VIVDASVATKWVVAEPGTETALALVDIDVLGAPDLIFSEVANAVWKKWRRGELTGVPDSLRAVADTLAWIEPGAGLMSRATALSIELAHPAYDCFYLALAEARDEVLVTADTRFVAACAGSGYGARVQLLGDIP